MTYIYHDHSFSGSSSVGSAYASSFAFFFEGEAS
jgi:hypothetical protein